MVIDENSLIPLHSLTEQGECEYKSFLMFEADKLIYFSKHPVDKILYSLSKRFQWKKIQDDILNRIQKSA